MTTPMPLGSAPYISPSTLLSAPTGIDWGTIPPGRNTSPQAKAAEQWNICNRVTDRVNGYCNQVLAATADVELLHGPDFRLTVGPGGGGGSRGPYWGTSGYNARALMSRWPILEVTQVTYCANNVWPRQWQTVPTGYFEPEMPPIGIYGSAAPSGSAYGGQAVLVAPGYVDWRFGRNGFAVQFSYINGWPHAEITQNATAGSVRRYPTPPAGRRRAIRGSWEPPGPSRTAGSRRRRTALPLPPSWDRVPSSFPRPRSTRTSKES